MDWKIPATIIILALVVSAGIIPFFSPEFSNILEKILDSFKKLSGLKLFEKEEIFNGSIEFSLSTREFDNLKIASGNIKVDTDGNYTVKIDGKKLILKEGFEIHNFTGLVEFKNFLISGECSKISTKNFEIEGKSKIVALEKNFKTLTIENLKIGELDVDGGNITIKSPQKISAELSEKIRLYKFKGSLIFEKDIITLSGNCTKTESRGFNFGDK